MGEALPAADDEPHRETGPLDGARPRALRKHAADSACAPEAVDMSELGGVINAGVFRPDYASWLPWPDAFDEHGFPIHEGGASTVVPGLYFVGVHFLRKRKSSLLIGVG